MIPKYRDFWKSEKKMITDISWIRFDKEDLIGKIEGQTTLPIGFSDVILMQSTGLFDGSLEPVEIYKDDIVTKSLPNGAVLVGVVTFTKGMFLVDGVEAIDQSWVVIGNIHEHPHLLEGLNGG